ncbi:MAG: diguanylate cyclase [Sphaerochaetaceae bacterium]|nr:diguanylate cyclase [Sphaerochaetaceae bacterium]
MNKIKLYTIFFLLVMFSNINIFAAQDEPYKILYLNSYHNGYTWSDEIYFGIVTVFESSNHPYEIDIEYMDTQRSMSQQYLNNLNEIYTYKYKNANYDLIIASDDAAYNFLRTEGEQIFGLTPIVFCGVNSFNESDIKDLPRFTGVVETYDISGTIELALKQNPKTKTIYYINDDSLTGKSIMKEIEPVIDNYSDEINFIRIDGKNYHEIVEKCENLPSDSIVLFLIYFTDRLNNHFAYDEAINILYNNCNRPIYGIWDFHLGHGILGGKLVSGLNQGELAANQALEILNGTNPIDIEVITEDTTTYSFDYNILKKYNLSSEDLPKDSKLINFDSEDSFNILILHSYNRNLEWTEDIERGLRDKISSVSDNIVFSIDYMDAKQHPDKKYQMYLYDFLSKKYFLNTFDLVITSDDAAFNFITTYSNLVSDDTPIFFCGVNNKIAPNTLDTNRITGLIETNDYKSTIDIMKKFHPKKDKIIVINDNTITGKANRINLEEIIPEYENELEFEFLDEINMNELLKRCENLSDNEMILLLSFTKDRSFNDFTYEESLRLISSHTDAPIYGLWNFYLGDGIVGGSLKNGYSQGAVLGEMINSYLLGTPISDIPIQTSKKDEYQFDYQQLEKFNIPMKLVPKEATIINKPFSIVNFVKTNFIYILGIILLLLIIILMYRNITLSKKLLKQEKSQARTDKLTGILNRRACFEVLDEQVEYCKENKSDLTVCFADINQLKNVNDNYGHEVGDLLIKSITEVFIKNIREIDYVCRLGGDEFLVIFPKTNIHQAQKILDQINNQIRKINQSNKYTFVLSFSYGFSQYDDEKCNNSSKLISVADKHMYEDKIKYRGKNKR